MSVALLVVALLLPPPEDALRALADAAFEPGGPGDGYAYSDSGYILLGAAIETMTGRDYGTAIEELIAAPFGLTDTRSALARGEDAVSGWTEGPDGWERPAPLHMSVPHAAGALVSTVDDLHRWVRAWRHAEVASRALVERAWSPVLHVPDADLTAVVLAANDSGRPEASYLARRALRLLLTGSPELGTVALAAEERGRARCASLPARPPDRPHSPRSACSASWCGQSSADGVTVLGTDANGIGLERRTGIEITDAQGVVLLEPDGAAAVTNGNPFSISGDQVAALVSAPAVRAGDPAF